MYGSSQKKASEKTNINEVRRNTQNHHRMEVRKIAVPMVVLFLSIAGSLFASGGYDHGTSTGKGKFEVDLTWNPFNIFRFGQSYAVLGYGITKNLDVHGYYSFHPEDFETYYYGLFYQFLDVKYLDLATAVGLRTNLKTGIRNLFFPQLLYNVKLGKCYTVGGSIVSIQDIKKLN